MRIAVFGETTRTKQFILNRALSAGYFVNVLDEVDSKKRNRKNLKVFGGKNLDLKNIKRVTKNTDAVLCLLLNPKHENIEIMNFIKNLASCMEDSAIRRLVIFSCIQENTATIPSKSKNLLTLILSKYKKSSRQYDIKDILKKTNIDWTIVGHPPVAETLSDDIAEYKQDPEGFRADLAKRLVGQITDVTYLHDTLLLQA